MTRSRKHILPVVAVLLALTAPHARAESWRSLVTDNFRLISSASDSATRDVAGKLETMNATLVALELAPASTVSKTTVFLFADRETLQPHLDVLLRQHRADANGVFIGATSGGAMLVDMRRSAGYDKTLYHELVHELLARRGTVIPLWLNEGLAEYFSSSVVKRGQTHFGQPLFAHLQYLRKRGMMPVEKILAITDADAYVVARQQLLFYAETWAIVHYLLRRPNAPAQLKAFLEQVERGESSAAAISSVYGLEAAELEREVRAYVRRTSWPLSAFRGNARDVLIKAPPAPMSAADFHYELGRVLERGLPENGEPAEEQFHTAVTLQPRHAAALAALARMAWSDSRASEGDELIARAGGAAATGDELTLVGETLLSRLVGPVPYTMPPRRDEKTLLIARQLFARAMALDPSLSRAQAGWGATHAVLQDGHPAAIDALRAAVEAAPQRFDFAMHLYVLLDAAGLEGEANRLRTRVLDASPDSQIRFAIRSYRLNRMAERANALSQRGEAAEAAKIVRSIAAETGEGEGRGEFLRQAESLEKLAGVNGEIETYNVAVSQFNERKYRAARETLDGLLAIATDARVIADARALRARVKRLL